MSVREDVLIAVIKWMDNNSVSMISTNEAVEPFSQVQQWSKVEKKYISVTQPKCINSYNKFMGGADRMISYCPSRARTKKWTVWAILHFFDLGLSNAWLQFREIKQILKVPAKNIPQVRKFKMKYGRSLIERLRDQQLLAPKSIERTR